MKTTETGVFSKESTMAVVGTSNNRMSTVSGTTTTFYYFCIIGLVKLVKREKTTIGDKIMHQTTVLGSMVCAVHFSLVTECQ